jgi:hypothetical protein
MGRRRWPAKSLLKDLLRQLLENPFLVRENPLLVARDLALIRKNTALI